MTRQVAPSPATAAGAGDTRELDFGKAWDLSPAPEATPVPLKERYDLFIDGKFVRPAAGKASWSVKIFHLAAALKAGVVWANTYNQFDPSSPFGGSKESGFSREGGVHGLLPYLTFA